MSEENVEVVREVLRGLSRGRCAGAHAQVLRVERLSPDLRSLKTPLALREGCAAAQAPEATSPVAGLYAADRSGLPRAFLEPA